MLFAKNIELTRFPVPQEGDLEEGRSYPALVRAADLIGQLSDPRYLNKTVALFYEFEETGANAYLGFEHPGDLRLNYPKFYWGSVHKYIRDALDFLSLSQIGNQIIANLHSNIFVVEHEKNGIADLNKI